VELDKETDGELRSQVLAGLGSYISGIQLAQTLLSAASEEEKQEMAGRQEMGFQSLGSSI